MSVLVKFKAKFNDSLIEENVELDTDYIDASDAYALKAFIDGEYSGWLLGFADDYEIIE